MNGLTRWAICTTDGRAHVLVPVGDHPLEVFQARCGHLLPRGIAHHEGLPGRLLCVTCLWWDLLPAPVFHHRIPAGRQLRAAPNRLLAASRFQTRAKTRQ